MKNKIILLFICLFLLCGCNNYRELNDLAIITGIAIDKTDNGYEMNFLIANSPKAQTSSKEGEAKTTVYAGTGKSLTEAVKSIATESPKQLYFGHIKVVVISEDIAKDGVFKVADWLIRNTEMRKQFYLLQAKGEKAGDILKVVSPLESFPSQSIATLIESNHNTQSLSIDTNYTTFVSRALETGYDPVLPSILIEGKVKKGTSEKNIETTEPEAYLKLSDIALFKKDKFVGYIDERGGQAINVLNNEVNELRFDFEYNDGLVGFSSANMKTKMSIKDINTVELKVNGSGHILGVDNKVDLTNTKVIKEIEAALEKHMEKELNKTIEKLQNKFKSDVLGIGKQMFIKYPDKWEKMKDEWNDKYFPKLKITIKTNITIDGSGSLKNSIEEVQS